MKRALLIIFLAALVGGGIWLVRNKLVLAASESAKAPVETAAVETRAIEQLVRAVGEVVAAEATDIKSEVSGRIQKLHVKAGDKVKAGDVLLEIDADDVKAELEEVTFRIEAAMIRRERAQMDFDRKKTLRAEKFLMEKDLTEADIELRRAHNALEGDRSRQKVIQLKVAKSTMRAPHDGIVLNVKVREGVVIIGAETAGDTTLLMQIADTSELQVQSDINEVDVIKVAVGAIARVTFDSVPGAIARGTVETLALSAQPKDRDKSIRVFPIMLVLEPTAAPIKPGITASIVISTAKKEKALAVPVSAIFVEEGKVFVYAKNAGGFDVRPVQTGISDTVFIEVKSGLKAGDEVALQRPPGLNQTDPPQG
jgi:macrolide-specific efflux system membrane fusion protein